MKRKLKFKGTMAELIEILREHDIRGEMHERPGFHRYETSNGAYLHWYPTGSICYQGPELSRSELEEKLEGVFDGTAGRKSIPENEEQRDILSESFQSDPGDFLCERGM